MNYFVEHWYIFFLIILVIATGALSIYNFNKMSPEKQKEALEEQKKKVLQWLIYAVVVAEKDLGGGTGQLKLSEVYGMFVTSFPWLVQVISFEEFSELVDEALIKMREMLENNPKVKAFIEANPNANITEVIAALTQITGNKIEMEDK